MNDAAQTLADQSVLTVDYDQSLEAMIAAGRYDWTNPGITSVRFPITGIGIRRVEARLFHFDRYISSDEAVAAITTANAENPWEPAKIEHLLSFGATHPDEQCKYPIIALGSVAAAEVGGRLALCLNWHDAGPSLGFGLRSAWNDAYRFLAVRNLPSGA